MEVTFEGCGFSAMLWIYSQRGNIYERRESPESLKEEEKGEEKKEGERKGRGREDPASAKGFSTHFSPGSFGVYVSTRTG